MRTPDSRNTLHTAARQYIERLWPVLPLVQRQKRPLTKNGLLDASIDPAVIDGWWTRWPNANIGLRTGVAFDALDIDGEVGDASLMAKTGPVEHTGPVSRTGRGKHWLYQPTQTANRTGILPKIDWRGVNGYIVAAPSIHPDGHLYTWEPGHGPSTPLPDIPDWLEPLLDQWTEPIPRPVIRPNPYDPLNRYDILNAAAHLGLHLDIASGRAATNCIWHEGDRIASLTLYLHNNTFYCFGCGRYGDGSHLWARTWKGIK